MKVTSLKQLNSLLQADEKLVWDAPVADRALGSFPMILAAALLIIVMVAWGGGVQIAAGLIAFGLIKLIIDHQDDSNEYLVLTTRRLLVMDRKARLLKQHRLIDVDMELINGVELIVVAKEGDLTTRWRCYPRTEVHLKHLEQSWGSMGRIIDKRSRERI